MSDRLMGLAVIAGAPTVFWTLLVYLATWAMDAPLSMSATLTIAAAVFAFLVCIWAAFALADRRPSRAA